MLFVNPETSGTECVRPWVFLAGTIDMGQSRNWQELVDDHMRAHTGTLFSPRKSTWSGKAQLSNPDFVHQVGWELDHLDSADVIAMNLEPDSKSPVSLLELGLFVRNASVIVRCDEAFYRHGNVSTVVSRYGGMLVSSFDEYLDAIAEAVTRWHMSAPAVDGTLKERPCPHCLTHMTWVDDTAGYFCRGCGMWVCVPRALGVVRDGTWKKIDMKDYSQ